MIPIKELQIGTRFEAASPPYNYMTECEVLSLKEDEIIAKTWLMDQHFQVTKFKDASYSNGDVVINLYAKTGVEGWYEDAAFTIKCDYVHLLQNAFKKATGEDLPLKRLF